MSNQSKPSKKTITLTNSIHGTEVNVRVLEGEETILEKQTIYRIRKTLCPVEDCKKCETLLNQIGETNPTVEERGDNIIILYKTERTKKIKMSEGDREDKEKECSVIHFTELEAKIMASGLDIDEKSKLFDFIRDIRNEYRDEVGLNLLGCNSTVTNGGEGSEVIEGENDDES